MMANDTYYFRAIKLNHSVEFQPKRVHKIQVLARDPFQLRSHIGFQVVLSNDQNPILELIIMN